MRPRLLGSVAVVCLAVGGAAAGRAQRPLVRSAPDAEREAGLALAADTLMYDRWFTAANQDMVAARMVLEGSLRDGNATLRAQAVRDLGRLRAMDNLPALFGYLRDSDSGVRAAAADGIAVTLDGVHDVEWVPRARAALESALDGSAPFVPSAAAALGDLLDDSAVDEIAGVVMGSYYPDRFAALEALTRHYPAHAYDPDLVQLAHLAARGPTKCEPKYPTTCPDASAAQVLINLHSNDNETASWLLRYKCPPPTRTGAVAPPMPSDECGWEFRRLGVLLIDPHHPEARALVESAIRDSAFQVRLEAVPMLLAVAPEPGVCMPLAALLSDAAVQVQMRALDLMRPSCSDRNDITPRVEAAAESLNHSSEWQMPMHAWLSLAKLAPASAHRILDEGAIGHPVWQVRAAAATVAAILGDKDAEAQLLQDVNPNVRSAALEAMGDLDRPAQYQAALEILGSPAATPSVDVQLVRIAAAEMSRVTTGDEQAAAFQALLVALRALSNGQGAESRAGDRGAASGVHDDAHPARMEIMNRLLSFAELGLMEDVQIEPFLKDPDPWVARLASTVMAKLLGHHVPPAPVAPPPVQPTIEAVQSLLSRLGFSSSRSVTIAMESNQTFKMTLMVQDAPIAVARFLALVRERYYDGMEFYRVVPNGVVYTGSPGSNEDVSHAAFARDEIGAAHEKGSVALWSHGADTSTMQFFVDLVDQPQLNYSYTVFGHIASDELQAFSTLPEGSRIRTITIDSSR